MVVVVVARVQARSPAAAAVALADILKKSLLPRREPITIRSALGALVGHRRTRRGLLVLPVASPVLVRIAQLARVPRYKLMVARVV